MWDSYDGPADLALAVRHAGAIMAARLHGKSPVEYLPDANAIARVMAVARAALADPTATIDDLLRSAHTSSEADVRVNTL
jgi:hypothetical protein